MATHYDVLGVGPDADTQEIRAAYRALARRYHPDAAGEAGGDAGRLTRVNEAWFVLRDPSRRAVYDSTLRTDGWTPTPTEFDVLDDDFDPDEDEISGSGPRMLHGLLWFAIIGVLGAIFLFTAFAGSPSEDTSDPSADVVSVGDCVRVQEGGAVSPAQCDATADGLVVAVVRPSDACADGQAAVRLADRTLCLNEL